MTSYDTTELLLLLAAAYPDQSFGDQTATVYERFLGDLDYETVKATVVNHVATSRWFPKVADLREAALELELGLPSSADAVLMLRGDHLHRLVKQALDLTGGTWEMNRTTNPTAWRAQFRKNYDGLRELALVERRAEATQKLLAQFPTKQLEDHDGPAQLT